LPPLPARPPESGSALSFPTAATSSKPIPPPVPLKAHSGEGCGNAAGADEATLRLMSLSGNAKVATPPPMSKRHAGESTAREGNATPSGQVTAEIPIVDTLHRAEPDIAGATEVAPGLEDSFRGEFSELARAFTCMEVV
jgi:hypothetical protein